MHVDQAPARLLLVSVVFVAVGCAAPQSAADPGGSPATPSSTEMEPATARGLGAALLAHLPTDAVVSVGGASSPLTVLVETTDPSMESVAVHVLPAEAVPGRRDCGTDSGYQVLVCAPGPPFIEVMERASDAPLQPSYMGRTYDGGRGDVLVQVWGDAGEAAPALVDELLRDRLLGLQTTEALNAEGEALSDFGELRFATEARPAG